MKKILLGSAVALATLSLQSCLTDDKELLTSLLPIVSRLLWLPTSNCSSRLPTDGSFTTTLAKNIRAVATPCL